MGVKFSKRFSAFIIDLLIIACISSVVTLIIPTSSNAKKMSEELVQASQDYIDKKIDEEEYINKSAPYTYRIDKENFLISVIDIVITILYFVVFAFIKGGQTLGKKLIGIKVVKQKGELSINDMIFRAFIINSLLSNLINLVLLFTTKDMTYVYATSIVSYLQMGLILVSAIMVLVRKDHLALHDIITKTKVVEVKA